MPNDSSLTDFAATDGTADAADADEPTDGGASAIGETDADADADGAESETEPDGPAESGGPAVPAPARSTYEWNPTGATCADCGERTTRRWRRDGDLVCPDCKTW